MDIAFRHQSDPREPPVNRKANCVASILQRRIGPDYPKRILVVGCGSGSEAAVLAQRFGSSVTGIDIDPAFDPAAMTWAKLHRGDATNLEFPDRSFDLVFSYHALEHIPQWEKALQEMRRILTPGGWFCVGTPNRLRLVGYLGAENTTVREKILWNYNDWRARLRGRFRNEYGAHAGFSESELHDMLKDVFPSVENISFDYYRELYPKYGSALMALWSSRAYTFAMPAIYFMGQVPSESNRTP